MTRRRAFVALSLGLGATACSQAPALEDGVPTDAGVAAIALPQEQLRTMIGQSVMGSHSGPIALLTLGLERGCDVFAQASEQAVARHLPQWQANLTKAYRDQVPAAKLAEAVGQSPREARELLRAYLPPIGSAMQAVSSPILAQASAEVVSAMSDAAVGVPGIDQQQRERDLQRMTSEGKICGLGRMQESA